MITLSPPPDPPTQLSLKSPNLAAEVAEALQQERDDATPTLCHSFSTTPTEDEDDENSKLLSSDEDKEFIIVSNGGGGTSTCICVLYISIQLAHTMYTCLWEREWREG